MTADVVAHEEPKTSDTASMEEAYLAIPDEDNPPIIDARKTFVITVWSAILFIAVVFIFIM